MYIHAKQLQLQLQLQLRNVVFTIILVVSIRDFRNTKYEAIHSHTRSTEVYMLCS